MNHPVLPFLFGLVLVAGSALPLAAQETVFLIRHAERDWSHDGGLVEAGRDRARGWGEVLTDAGIDVIITSEMQRTRQTGQPIAEMLEVPIIAMPRADYDGLLTALATTYDDDRVLIVSHSSSIPEILRRLGHPILFHIAKSDYNDLFVLHPAADGPPHVVRLNVD